MNDTYLPLLADRKSHEGGSVAGKIVLTSRLAVDDQGSFSHGVLMHETQFLYSDV